MPDYPTGTVTLVFTDLEGSSELSEKHGAAFEPVRDEHFTVLRNVAMRWHGYEVETAGDSLFVIFSNAADAVQFAVDAQRALAEFSWPEEIGDIRVRMGMHSGEPYVGLDQGRPTYRGPVTNRAARVQAAGHGGQVLLSQATRDLALPSLPPDISLKDLGRHRLKGVGDEHFWQVCHPALREEFATLNTLPPTRHNLPLPQTPFVGREAEVLSCIELLRQPSTRLLTLLAFGGMGKTRTALQIAELCFDDFKDGVWWVSLENATTGEEMIARIAEQLRVHLQPQPSVREQVWEFHRDRQLLLVLDNLEQIQGDEAAQVIHGLLNAGPRVKCLVTSRRALNMAAERVFELQPLPISDAETLFAQRASARKSSFALNEQNSADVEAICRTLEGVPLAIEIAASLIVLLAPKQILKKLDDQLKALVARDPTLPPRQQALRAAIDWSYSLLPEPTQVLFAQLAVFAGGFMAEAAESICQCEQADVFDGLLEIRNHSLLRAVTDESTQQERLTMLESVRSFACEKLQATPDEYSDSQRRHAEYFVTFVEEHAALLRTREEAVALAELEPEFDNLREALAWATAHDNELGARIALAFHQPLHFRGFWNEAREVLDAGWQAAEMLGEDGAVLRAWLRHHLASLAHDLGEIDSASNHAEKNLLEFRELHDATGEANALNLLALLATDNDDDDRAQQLCETALQLWPRSEPRGKAKTLHNLARLASRRGDLETARQRYEECLVERRRAGDARGEAETLGNLGVLAQKDGNIHQALNYYRKSLDLRRQLQDPHGIAIMLYNLAELAEMEESFERSMVLFIHADRIFEELRSAYAGAPARALVSIREKLGEAKYSELYNQASKAAWEDKV